MRKLLKYLLGIIIIIILVLSIFYMNSEHEYDLSRVEDITTDEEYINVVYEKEEPIEDETVLGILSIEKIKLKATVKEGSTPEVLRDYIGHIIETAKYDGNIGLAAHNRRNRYSYFARLNELEKGDLIEYKTKFDKRTYKVVKKQ